jgi:hypothetical protein
LKRFKLGKYVVSDEAVRYEAGQVVHRRRQNGIFSMVNELSAAAELLRAVSARQPPPGSALPIYACRECCLRQAIMYCGLCSSITLCHECVQEMHQAALLVGNEIALIRCQVCQLESPAEQWLAEG